MDEIALNILDIVYNSIKANSSFIQIYIEDSMKDNCISVVIADNGSGMDQETLNQVTNPFYTTRTTRKVGLGLSLFKQQIELTNGTFKILSKQGYGSVVYGQFVKDNIDTPPLGNIIETMLTLIQANESIDYYFIYINDEKEYLLDTREIKDVISNLPINDLEILNWIKNNMKEGIQ